jgi:diadenosine tetraphosphate (Ap4A) HIT family hydrolase
MQNDNPKKLEKIQTPPTRLLTREEYDKIFIPSIPKNVCTFCHWEKYQIILKEFQHWVWIANLAPYWWWHTMVISKRHFVEFDEQTYKENAELLDVLSHVKRKMLDAKLKRADGSDVKKIIHFWRFRANRFDPISGTVRPDHFHIHIVPDKDHLWDPILDEDAHKCDIVSKLGEEDVSVDHHKTGQPS